MTRSGKRQHGLHRREASDIFHISGTAGNSEALTPVVFKGTGPYLVAGPESQQVYCFSPHDPEQMVEARDAAALLKTELFRIGS